MHMFDSEFLFTTSSFEILAIFWNLYFIHYMLNKGQTDNRCFFLQHLCFLCLANCLAMLFQFFSVENPDLKDSSRTAGGTIWFCGVYSFGLQTFSLYTLAFSRIVSITFKRTQIDSIWSCTVALFATFIQITFPLILGAAPFIDDPQMIVDTSNDGEIVWKDKGLQWGYVVSSTVMRLILAVTIFILYIAVIIRRIKVLSRAVNRPRHIVHSVYGEGQGDIMSPNTMPYYSSRSVNLSILLTVMVGFEIAKQCIMVNGFPSRNEFQVIYAIFMSCVVPTAIFIQYQIPRIWSYIKYSSCFMSYFIKVEQTQECSFGDGQNCTESKTRVSVSSTVTNTNSHGSRFSLVSNKVGNFSDSTRPSLVSLDLEGSGSPTASPIGRDFVINFNHN